MTEITGGLLKFLEDTHLKALIIITRGCPIINLVSTFDLYSCAKLLYKCGAGYVKTNLTDPYFLI